MIGVSFQPGTSEADQMKRREQTGSAQGVQEAIKVLSLRLPKVVGAQAAAPQALLTAPGAQGNPNVDSIVESVLSKMFGQGRQQPTAPMVPTMQQPSQPQQPQAQTMQGPSASGFPASPQRDEAAPQGNFWSQFPTQPRITVGTPPEAPLTAGPISKYPNLPGVDGGGAFPNASIEPFPGTIPNLRKDYLDWLQPAPSEQPLI